MRNMRGALILMLVVLMVSGIGVAEEYYALPEIYRQAREGWMKTYSAQGRTIDVDIPINVPEADVFPILECFSAHPSTHLPVFNTDDLWGLIDNDIEVANAERFLQWFSPSNQLMNSLYKDNQMPKDVSISSKVLSINDIEREVPYAVRNAATVRDADALLRSVWQTCFPHLPFDIMPFRVEAQSGARPFDDAANAFYGDEWEEFQGMLTVYFNQVFHHIPFIGMMEMSFEGGSVLNMDTLFNGWGPYCVAQLGGRLFIEQFPKNRESVTIIAIGEENMVQADVPLLGLERIISAYEQLIHQGKLRRVDNLRLGYVGWYHKEDMHRVTLMPTWVAEGVLLKHANMEPHSVETSNHDTEFAYIMVNAQTGELIDPWDDNPSRVYDIPEITQWNQF